jgi:hypothetical protein
MTFTKMINRSIIIFSSMVAMVATQVTYADTVTVAGVKVEDTAQVGKHNLKMNGVGIRTKFIFKVYVAALYLNETKSTTQDVLSVSGAKRVHLVMLRDMSNDDFAQAFMDGMRNNLDVDERSKLIKPMITFGQMFSEVSSLKKGDIMMVDWVPGAGVETFYNGKKVGETISDPGFYNAVLKIWLGNKPADASLKKKLLNITD